MCASVYSGTNMHLKVLISFEKNGPDFKIAQTDLEDRK